MERTLLIIAGLLGVVSLAHTQSCLPQGITFNLQSEVNAFPNNHPGCTQIQGFLKIGPSNDASAGGITDLTPLSQITSVGGYLLVEATLGLQELTGLENLTSVGGYVKINMNDFLLDISALSNLSTVGGYLEVRLNPDLISLEGLGSVTSTGGNLVVHLNSGLTDLQGLGSLADIGGGCSIENNSGLVSMNGLSPASVGTAFWVKGNPLLADLSAASGLTSIGGLLNIQDNASLASLEGLSGITALGGYLRVQNCPLITDLSPLANIDPTTINQLLFEDLPGVSDCALENVCAYLALPSAQPTIANNASGCASVAEVEAACSTTSIADAVRVSGMAMQVFPNPSEGIVHVKFDRQGAMLFRVFDMSGRIVHEERLVATGTSTQAIDLSNLGTGIYTLRLDHPTGSFTSSLVRH